MSPRESSSPVCFPAVRSGQFRNLDALRRVNDPRLALDHQIHDLLNPGVVAPADPGEYVDLVVTSRVLASHFVRCQQEVTYHRFSICIAQINRLLPFIPKAHGFSLAKDDKEVLNRLMNYCDQFEHLDDRLATAGPGSGRTGKRQGPGT
jgi:hypothetical protein